MKNIKINVDRPKISSEDIQKKMNFEDILANHQIIAKPFYKTPWFFGTTGLATVTLIATTIYGFEDKPQVENHIKKRSEVITNSPPVKLLSENDNQKTKQNIKNELPIEKKSTLTNKTTNQKPLIKKEEEIIVSASESVNEKNTKSDDVVENNDNTKKVFNYFDLHPRIAGKVNGEITKQQLFDDKGLVTNTDVDIIHFELHLVDGTGGKVFEENGHLLTKEMKEAIERVEKGNEIYFESIKGITNKGEEIRLNPLRYTLLN